MTKDDLQKIKQDKLNAVRRAFKNIDKIVGVNNAVYTLKEKPFEQVDVIPTGSVMLDCALQVGGIPRGRIIECSGVPSSGKTLIALRTIAQAQKMGLVCAYIDSEQSFDNQWSILQGVNTDELLLSQPATMEQTFKIIIELIKTESVDLIVLDSIGSLLPEQELDDNIDKQHMALVARGLSKFLRIVNPLCAQTGCCLFCINQLRASMSLYGPAYTTTGGNALRYYCSVRMEANKVSGSTIKEKIGTEDVPISHEIKVKITKSKVAAPFRTATFRIYYDGRKVDPADEIADVILVNGLIPRYDSSGNISAKGRKYKFDWEDEHLEINKRADMADALRRCPKILQHFIDAIKSGDILKDIANNQHADDDITEEEFFKSLDDNNDSRTTASEAEEIETFSDEF